jgi:hypothetical protein
MTTVRNWKKISGFFYLCDLTLINLKKSLHNFSIFLFVFFLSHTKQFKFISSAWIKFKFDSFKTIFEQRKRTTMNITFSWDLRKILFFLFYVSHSFSSFSTHRFAKLPKIHHRNWQRKLNFCISFDFLCSHLSSLTFVFTERAQNDIMMPPHTAKIRQRQRQS